MSPPTARACFATWIALLVLLGATFGLAQVDLGGWNTVAAVSIAAAKAVLVALFFMNLVRAPALVAFFAAAGLVGLAILFGLSATDYAHREQSPAAYAPPAAGDERAVELPLHRPPPAGPSP
jgi:cytochrome c oxidase subunit 4